MNGPTPLLDAIRIASPCSADWSRMVGDDRVRFCAECKLHVFDLSALSAVEAERLVRQKGGRLCARLHRRADGTVLTRDCPVGLRALRRRARAAFARCGALLGALLAGLAGCSREQGEPAPTPPAAVPVELLGEVCVPDASAIMGRIAAPEPPHLPSTK